MRKESEDLINTFIRTDGLTLQAVAFTLRTASGRVSHVVTRPVAAAFMLLTGHVRLSVTRPGSNELVHILNNIKAESDILKIFRTHVIFCNTLAIARNHHLIFIVYFICIALPNSVYVSIV